jgi:hypothetical protein
MPTDGRRAREVPMRRTIAAGAAVVLLAFAAAPVAAMAPEQGFDSFVTDPYVIAECDGYDVMEQMTIYVRYVVYLDRDGDFVREVAHATNSAVEWRSDTDEQLATYRDAGGTFSATAGATFTWTGIHNEWTLASGEVIRDVGRVVVAEVAPGEFERVFEAGQLPETDPCTW